MPSSRPRPSRKARRLHAADAERAKKRIDDALKAAKFRLHGVWLDGVYTQRDDGQLSWTPMPALSDRDVQEVLQTVIARLLAWLRRAGRLTDDDRLTAAEADDEPQLVLEALATAAVGASSLAGPELRAGRVPQLHLTSSQPRRDGRLLASSDGFTLHARTTVAEGDKAGRERLIKYILRPPLAAERSALLPRQGASPQTWRPPATRPAALSTLVPSLLPGSLACRRQSPRTAAPSARRCVSRPSNSAADPPPCAANDDLSPTTNGLPHSPLPANDPPAAM